MRNEQDETSVKTTELSWSSGPASSRVIRIFFYVFIGTFGGLLVGMTGFVGYIIFQLLVQYRGQWIEIFGIGSLVVIGIIFWRLAQTILIIQISRKANLHWTVEEFAQVSRPHLFVSASLIGAIGQWLLFLFSPTMWIIGFVGTLFASVLGGGLLISTGSVDRESRTLTYEGSQINLDFLNNIRLFHVSQWTILWLSFVQGRASNLSPRLLVFPTDVFNEMTDVFEAGIAQDVKLGETERLKQGVIFFTGVGLLGIGISVYVVISQNTEGVIPALMLASMFGLFGLLFLRLALFN